MKTNSAIGALAVAFLAACTSAPVPDADAEVVPLLTQRSGDAIAIVTRDSGLLHAPYDARLYVDGERLANLRPSQQIRVPLVAGHHVIAVEAAMDPAPHGGIELEVKPGETRRYRVVAYQDHFAVEPAMH
jgi:hypothetical protein